MSAARTGPASRPLPSPQSLQPWQRGAAAVVLGSAYLVASRRRAGPGEPRARLAVRAVAEALCATAGPVSLLVRRLGGGGARWQPPPSIAGRLLLGGYVLAGALIEESLWRAPLILLSARSGSARRAIGPAVLSGAGFLALHLRRDGSSSLPVHLTTTASWTVSALLGRHLRWPLLAHAGYNFAAASLRAAAAPAS